MSFLLLIFIAAMVAVMLYATGLLPDWDGRIVRDHTGKEIQVLNLSPRIGIELADPLAIEGIETAFGDGRSCPAPV